MQDGFIESFNGRLRDELLNEALFCTLAQSRMLLDDWKADYNRSRPTCNSAGERRPSSPQPLPRAGLRCCATPKALRQRPSLHPPVRASQTPETNSRLDKTAG
jgi:putative transposase